MLGEALKISLDDGKIGILCKLNKNTFEHARKDIKKISSTNETLAY